MFYDENGRHVRTKKEILDESGNIRNGCKIIKKGEVYERKLFTAKDKRFKGLVLIAVAVLELLITMAFKKMMAQEGTERYEGSESKGEKVAANANLKDVSDKRVRPDTSDD